MIPGLLQFEYSGLIPRPLLSTVLPGKLVFFLAPGRSWPWIVRVVIPRFWPHTPTRFFKKWEFKVSKMLPIQANICRNWLRLL